MNTLHTQNYLQSFRQKKDGTAPVVIRVSLNAKRVEIPTGVSVDPKKWDDTKQRAKGTSIESATANSILESYRAKITNFYNENFMSGGITADDIKNYVTGKRKKTYGILELYDIHMAQAQELVKIGELVRATYVKHRTVRNHFADFIGKDMPVSKVDGNVLNDFHHYLRTKKGISNNTTMKYVYSLGQVLNIADEKNYILKTPMRQYKPKKEKKRPRSLTRDELHRIEELDLSHEKRKSLDVVRDSFIFCCYTGLSYSDIKKLTLDRIEDRDGEKILMYNRKKNQKEAGTVLFDEPLAILNKYAEWREITNTKLVMPVLSNPKSNLKLKTIQEMARISLERINLTFHVSRHTFASAVTLREGLDMSKVSSALGHSSIAQTEQYAELLTDDVIEGMKVLRDRLRQQKQERPSSAKGGGDGV